MPALRADVQAGVPQPRGRHHHLPSARHEQIGSIVELQLKRLRKLLAERKLTLEVTDQAKQRLAEEGYDPAFGARPLKRAIQR